MAHHHYHYHRCVSLALYVLVAAMTIPAVMAYTHNSGGGTTTDTGKPAPMHQTLDTRWKSTKYTQAEKAEMGWFPPPGEKWPEDSPEASAAKKEEEEEEESGGGTQSIIDTVEEEDLVTNALAEEHEEIEEETKATTTEDEQDQNTDAENDNTNNPSQDYLVLSDKTFLRYEPSDWEKQWVNNIEKLEGSKEDLCNFLMHGKHQTDKVHDFMDILCSARLEGQFNNWCYYHDHNHWMWYNSANRDVFEIYIDATPMILEGIDPPPMSMIEYQDCYHWVPIASKLVYRNHQFGNEVFEWIEPLVAQLKFPLAECLDRPKPLLTDFASHVLPPAKIPGSRTLLFDVGSRDWSRLEYLIEEWEARGAEFSDIISYSTSQDETHDPFLTTVPEKHQSHIYRQYFLLSSEPSQDEHIVFIPTKIQEEAGPDDYVVLKLDRAPAKLKESIVHYILDNDVHVDELIWEINSSGNHALDDWMDANRDFDEISSMSLADAYHILTRLREKGIRAHSWI